MTLWKSKFLSLNCIVIHHVQPKINIYIVIIKYNTIIVSITVLFHESSLWVKSINIISIEMKHIMRIYIKFKFKNFIYTYYYYI